MISLSIGLLFIVMLWSLFTRRWQCSIYMLLIYMPLGGAVTLSLYPSTLPILFKDLFFVIPAYFSFFASRRTRVLKTCIPNSIIGIMLVLVALVLLESFNPGVANWMVALIGVKVWLFYLPLTFLASAIIITLADLIRLLRFMVAISWIPCVVGIIQWIACMNLGYEVTMTAFYGAAAEGATQGFATFDFGGTFFRIPSTFTFVTQYFGYTLAMIVPTYALTKIDDSPNWRRFASATFWLVVSASFMSGARSAYLFVPVLLALIFILEGKFIGVVKIGIILLITLLAVMSITEIDLKVMFITVLDLVINYSDAIAIGSLWDAICSAPWGMGTGMNTGPARYAFDDPDLFTAYENYYAKAVYELGVAGVLIVVSLFFMLIRCGYRNHCHIQHAGIRSCSAAILAFIVTMVLNSFKGWQIDLDPVNVYFWLFSGIIFKLDYLSKLSQVPTMVLQLDQARTRELL